MTPSDAAAAAADGGQAVEVAAHDLGARGLQGGGGAVGAGEARDLVARAEQLGGDGGADVTGRTGDENAHGGSPGGRRRSARTCGRLMSLGVMTVARMSRGVVNGVTR
jgi:hypothetical protein